MSESCEKHHHEKSVGDCRRCGHSWCASCLVYAFGPKKPPFCMACAMVAGGVRTSATLPAISRRERRVQKKAHRAAARAARDVPMIPDPEAEAAASQAPVAEPASSGTDWAAPWWEDREPTLSGSH